ncbi:ABC transporter ATP-binding protein [Candidatus Uhrbacteria bacterium]|nr:ABC transporter ATP-binding protein [Candidatus Uhrbacteria bacterium]
MIEISDIRKAYRVGDIETLALDGVSFRIEKGDFVAIMGQSGSGKSTLMHIIGCLDSPTSGRYFLGGHDVSRMTDDELSDVRRDQIGFVFQAFNLLPRATAIRNVSLPLIYANVLPEERDRRAGEALLAAGLPEDRWHHHSNELSGGQKQRVAIARALVNSPAIVLADEPTGNLDSKTGEVVLETFRHLNCDLGHTILLITHERYVAEHADRIITLKDGRIVSDEEVRSKHPCPVERQTP